MFEKYKLKFESKEDLQRFSTRLRCQLNNKVKEIYLDEEGRVENVKYRIKPYVDKSTKKLGNRLWEDYWFDMPYYVQSYPPLYNEIYVVVPSKSKAKFQFLIEQTISSNSYWYPKKHKAEYKDKWFRGSEHRKNNYPIYIPSLGRWDCCYTADSLIEMGVDNFFIIVEEQEYGDYARFYPSERLIVLDKKYQEEYDTLDNIGNSKRVGPGASRNFAWDHSISLGYEYHWVLDDNIRGFQRFYNNKKVPIKTPVIFDILENFTKRFSNVGMSGMNYRFFCVHNKPAFQLNTRIYSCNFIRNDLPFRWRGRYNEDTILSLDMITKGWNTILFNLFLIGKIETQTMKGGNNDIFYKLEGTYNKSKMLKEVYPQYVRLVTKYGRDHHYIDYKVFENINPLQYRKDYIVDTSRKINENGIYFG